MAATRSVRSDPVHRREAGITVFVIVALVAFVRKLMVASLNAEKMESACFYLGAIFVLGFVYMMVGLTDRKRNPPSPRE